MFKNGLTFHKISNFLYEKVISSRLFFIVGDLGINVLYYKNKTFVESYFLSKDKINEDPEFDNFIAKYKKSDAKIICNLKNASLQHESLTVIGGLSKANPVEKYCESHLHSSDLYTYKVYSIINGEADLWKAIIMWTPITPEIEKCLFVTKENGIVLAGVYFYNFALQAISNSISKSFDIELRDYIYSSVSICETAGINISINHENNILHSVICDYPHDKSAEYIQGVIEQNLSDCWLKFKAYIEQNNLKKINIFLLPPELKVLIEAQVYDVERSIFADSASHDQVNNNVIFLNYFNKSEQLQALSSELKSYYRYHLVNNVLFKICYIALLLLCMYSVNLKIKIINIENKTSKIYKHYFKLTEDIRLQSQNFPNIVNISQLADLYNLQTHLKEKTPLPFEYMEDLVHLTKDFAKLTKVSWTLNPMDKYSEFILNCDIETIGHTDPLKMLEKLSNELHIKYPDILSSIQRIALQDSTSNPKSIGIRITLSGAAK